TFRAPRVELQLWIALPALIYSPGPRWNSHPQGAVFGSTGTVDGVLSSPAVGVSPTPPSPFTLTFRSQLTCSLWGTADHPAREERRMIISQCRRRDGTLTAPGSWCDN